MSKERSASDSLRFSSASLPVDGRSFAMEGRGLPVLVYVEDPLSDRPVLHHCNAFVLQRGFLEAAGGQESCSCGAFARLGGSAFCTLHNFCGDGFPAR